MATLTPKQNKAVDFCLSMNKTLVLARPGSGKTRIALEVMYHTDFKRALIVAPPFPAATSWRQENEKWGFGFYTRYAHGKNKVFGGERVTIITYDALEWFKECSSIDQYDFIIYDEIHKMKNTGSVRFSRWRKEMKDFKFVLGLTGTPTPDKMEGLFGQSYCIDQGETFGTTVRQFQRRYMFPHPNIPHKWLGDEAGYNMVLEKMAPFTIALDYDKDTVKGLTLIEVPIPMSEEAKKIYSQMKKNGVVEGTTITAVNAAVKAHKLKQIAAGNVYDKPITRLDEKGNIKVLQVPVAVHNHKINALKQLIDDLQGDPLLVFFEYGHDKEAIKKHIPGIECVDSSTSSDEMIDIVERWNKGEITVLMGQVMRMGIGGNMQFGGANICFFSMPWAIDVLEQSIGRLYGRIGQERDVVVHFLCCEGTIDFDIAKKLKGKKQWQDKMFERLK